MSTQAFVIILSFVDLTPELYLCIDAHQSLVTILTFSIAIIRDISDVSV